MGRTYVGTRTDRMLAAMMRGYGDVRELLDSPEITVEVGRYVVNNDGSEVSDDAWVELNTFHYLRHRLEYDHMLSMSLALHLSRHGDRLVNVNEFAARMDDGDSADRYFPAEIVYTYNFENKLSEEFQVVTFTRNATDYAIVQISYGASAFNLTMPKVFQIMTDDSHDLVGQTDEWSFGHDVALTNGAELPGMDVVLPAGAWRNADDDQWHVTHGWDKESGSSDGWIDREGSFVTLDDLMWRRPADGVWGPMCPDCGAVCDVYAPTAW
jgi:hypothetical protein